MTRDALVCKHYDALMSVWSAVSGESERRVALCECLHGVASDLLLVRVSRKFASGYLHSDLQVYFRDNLEVLSDVLSCFTSSTGLVLSIDVINWLRSAHGSVLGSCLSAVGVLPDAGSASSIVVNLN